MPLQVVAMERKSEGGLFAALDNYLKSQRVKFRVGTGLMEGHRL